MKVTHEITVNDEKLAYEIADHISGTWLAWFLSRKLDGRITASVVTVT